MKAPLPRETGRIGLGCASLGSRIDRRKGLDALARARAAGMMWFDLAPSYGDGQAESIFGEFAAGRRDQLVICTKVGIAPPSASLLMQLVKPLARVAINTVPQLRRGLAHVRPKAYQLPLDAGLIRYSLEQSLRKLRTDYVDILALHDPDATMLASDDVLTALQAAVRSGKARAIGIAGSVDVACAAIEMQLDIDVVQIPDGPGEQGPARIAAVSARAVDKPFMVTHSIFNGRQFRQSIGAGPAERETAQNLLEACGYGSLSYEEAIRSAAIDGALRSNPNGIVLLSMFSESHLLQNLACLDARTDHNPEKLFEDILLLTGGRSNQPRS